MRTTLEKRVPILSAAREAAAEICGEDDCRGDGREQSPRDHHQPAPVLPAPGDDKLQEKLTVSRWHLAKRVSESEDRSVPESLSELRMAEMLSATSAKS